MDRVDRAAVERRRSLGRRVVDAADDLRHVARRPVGAPRVDPLRREREVEVDACDETGALLEDGLHVAAGGARVGGRLEHDEVTRAQPGGDLARCAAHDREIGLALARERRRERDQDRVGVAQLVVVGGGAQAALARPARGASRAGRPRCSSRRGSAAATRSASTSTSSTERPASANTCASGTPTYPAPTMATSTVARSSALAGGEVSGTVTARNRTGAVRSRRPVGHPDAVGERQGRRDRARLRARRRRAPAARRGSAPRATAATSASGSSSTSTLAPSSTVSTHSVEGRAVTQGTPYQYASFCSPPESVTITRGLRGGARRRRGSRAAR